jgi:hypothetical protein
MRLKFKPHSKYKHWHTCESLKSIVAKCRLKNTLLLEQRLKSSTFEHDFHSNS